LRGIPGRVKIDKMKILLFPNSDRDKGYAGTFAAAEVLLRAGAEVVLSDEHSGAAAVLPSGVKFEGGGMDKIKPDIVAALGGDGTFLKAARQAAACGIPIMGVNHGNVGFLTEVEPCNIDCLAALITGGYRIEERMMLDAHLLRGGEEKCRLTALNDCVITRGARARNIHLSLFSDGCELTEIHGDGVVVSTPTGTTAYSLSAGGPIVEPAAECIVITPVCAHALYARSFVMDRKRTISVKVGRLDGREAYLSADGVDCIPLCRGDEIRISRSATVCRVIKISGNNFFNILKEKLAK
jgi:NAD+ kinase